MANGKSAEYQAVIDSPTKLYVRQNDDALQMEIRHGVETVTLLGNEGVNDYHDLAGPRLSGVEILPEESRIRFGGTGTVNLSAKLAKVAADGTVTDITAAAALTAAAAVPFAPAAAIAATAPIQLARGDRLRLIVTAVTTTTAGRIILVEYAYRLRGR
jgi:hypothetical protein